MVACYMLPLIGGWGVLNREIVLFRSRVRTRGLAAQWNWISISVGRSFLFSLLAVGSFPFLLFISTSFYFSLPHPPNLLSNFSWAYL